MTKPSYKIELVAGYSAYDHLAPILDYARIYPTRAQAKKALQAGQAAQGTCAQMSRQVRCDIVAVEA